MSVLNKVKPYLQRASELDSFEPVVAYYCRLHALNMLVKARQSGETSDELQAVMLDALKRSEDRKQVVDLSTGQETMELFASTVFETADSSDRGGRTDKTTASNFWASATLMEVCGQFYDGGMPPDLAEKVRYAKYRAVKIRDCIRQGIDPSPPQDELAAYMDESGPYADASAPPPAAAPAPAAPAGSEAQQLREQIARAEEAQRLREKIARAEAGAAAAAPAAALAPQAPAASEAQRLRAQIAAAEAAAAAPAPAPAPAVSSEAQRLREQLAAAEAAAAARSAPAAAPRAAPAAPAPGVSAGPIPPGRPRTNLADDAKAAAKKKAEFASSAIDFDDVASAKKLLREALALIEQPI